jgi:DNA processing protein
MSGMGASPTRPGRAAEFELLTFLDRRYPLVLRLIEQMPPVLFGKGRLLAGDEVGVSVVGSREASNSGLGIVADIARGLVGRGITVRHRHQPRVSGGEPCSA